LPTVSSLLFDIRKADGTRRNGNRMKLATIPDDVKDGDAQ